MEINLAVSNLVSNTAQSPTGDAVNLLVLRKAMLLEGSLALQLIASVPQSSANPAHLGQNVDVKT
jgi:hypothetical protein